MTIILDLLTFHNACGGGITFVDSSFPTINYSIFANLKITVVKVGGGDDGNKLVFRNHRVWMHYSRLWPYYNPIINV